MDVGSGTGILALFAAMEGASRVFAVESSSKLCTIIKRLAIANQLDHKIVVVNSRVEDIQNIKALWKYPTVADEQNPKDPEDQRKQWQSENNHDCLNSQHCLIDILISEWMGFYLLHEGMLSTVLYARDKFLKPLSDGGIMLPERASIYLTIGSSPKLWNDKIGWTVKPFHGLDISALTESLLEIDCASPIIDVFPVSSVQVASIQPLLTFDLWIIEDTDLETIVVNISPILHAPPPSAATTNQDGSIDQPQLHGFILWFDVEFPITKPHEKSSDIVQTLFQQAQFPYESNKYITQPIDVQKGIGTSNPISQSSSSLQSINHSKLILDTSPFSPSTHWKQCALLFNQPMDLIPDLKIHCKVKLEKSERRFYEISVDVIDVESVQ